MDINEIKYYYDLINKYSSRLNSNKLDEKDLLNIKEKIKYLESMIDVYFKIMFKLGSILDYNELYKKGFNESDVLSFKKSDDEYLDFCLQTLKDNKENHDYMFGYPANMVDSSYFTRYLKYLETKLYYMNNCGDPREIGNYLMDNKKNELAIINLFKKNLNLIDYSGYITTGGTEGNIQGINLGFKKYPNGILYYSKDAHYSILKTNYQNKEEINTINSKIDVSSLLEKIVLNYKKNKNPAIIVLTYGTTKTGSIDNIELIKKTLTSLNIPFYIHVDAALYGGIPSNQVNSPRLDFNTFSVDSISISMHKYLGVPRTNGVLLVKENIKDNYIDYIGQNDTTLSGSRDFLAFSTYQIINEMFNRCDKFAYINNIIYFTNLLKNNDIKYIKGNNLGNIFIIEKPSDEICKKYQLATFTEDNIEYAHIIIFPCHKKEVMEELINDLKKTKKLIKE